MSRPDVSENDLNAWADGELPEARRAEVETYLAAHPEDAARLQAYRRNDLALEARYAPVLDEDVPARLVQGRRAGPRRFALRAAAAVAWIFLGGIAGWYLHALKGGGLQSETPSWARRAAIAHVVYSPEVRHPVEVPAEQEAHLAAWLSKRLGTPLKIPRLDAVGFGLVGGRLLPGDQGPVAQFMYQDGQGQRLTLYVRTNRDQNREISLRFAQEGNVRQFYWIDRSLGYVLSGEVGKEDLLAVATAVYKQLNP